jgi:hypothetical protein
MSDLQRMHEDYVSSFGDVEYEQEDAERAPRTCGYCFKGWHTLCVGGECECDHSGAESEGEFVERKRES